MSKIVINTNKHHYPIGEVAEMFAMNISAIRHWEKTIHKLKADRNAKGTRFFTPDNVEIIKIVYDLVNYKGMTLDGVNTKLQSRKEIEYYSNKKEILATLNNIKNILEDAKLYL
ncbi:MAG: MerR family transcriptional regulator [Bacteroidales bacterium]